MARFAGGDADMKNAVYRLVADWGHGANTPLTGKMREFFIAAMAQD